MKKRAEEKASFCGCAFAAKKKPSQPVPEKASINACASQLSSWEKRVSYKVLSEATWRKHPPLCQPYQEKLTISLEKPSCVVTDLRNMPKSLWLGRKVSMTLKNLRQCSLLNGEKRSCVDILLAPSFNERSGNTVCSDHQMQLKKKSCESIIQRNEA